MIRLAAAIGALSLAGCSATPPDLTKEQSSRLTNMELCQTYAASKALRNYQHMLRAKAELQERGAVTAQDVADMEKGVIRTGMKEYVAVCSWGPYRDVNTTQIGSVSSKQYVISLDTYFYTRNGRVYAWQD